MFEEILPSGEKLSDVINRTNVRKNSLTCSLCYGTLDQISLEFFLPVESPKN